MATFADKFPYRPEPKPPAVPEGRLRQFIEENPYAILVPEYSSEINQSVHATQLFAILEGDSLYGYIERKEPTHFRGTIAEVISDSLSHGYSRLVFPGPRTHLFVPTENGTVPLRLQMTAVVSGKPRLLTSIEDKAGIISDIQQLEGEIPHGGISSEYLNGIVGYRMNVYEITGTFELGQGRPDLQAIIGQLEKRGRPDDVALARYAKMWSLEE